MKARLLFGVFGIAVLSLAQQAPSTEQPPEGGPPRPFHLAKTEDFTLPNGMQVTLVPYGIVPRVAVRAYVQAGGINEPPDKIWISRLTGLLIKEGTQTRSGEEVAAEAASNGAQLEVEAGVEFTAIGGIALSDRAAQFIALIADVLQHPKLPESQLSRLKTDMGRELAVAKTKTNELARERFLQALFPNSPYGRVFPVGNQIEGYTIQDVQHFYHDNFGAARTHLYVAGRLDSGLDKAIRTAFEGWEKGSTAPAISTAPVKARSYTEVDRPGASQSTLYIGLPVADPTSSDYIPLDVTNALLGGSFTSRITSNIREQKGYTYSPSSQIATRKHLAYWVEVADVTTAVTGASMQEIFSEVDRLRKEPPSQQELKGIQTYLAGLFVLRNTISPDALISQLHFVDLQGLNRSFLSEYVGKVAALKPEDVQGMAEKYLVPDKMAIVVVGDHAKITDQVKPYQALGH